MSHQLWINDHQPSRTSPLPWRESIMISRRHPHVDIHQEDIRIFIKFECTHMMLCSFPCKQTFLIMSSEVPYDWARDKYIHSIRRMCESLGWARRDKKKKKKSLISWYIRIHSYCCWFLRETNQPTNTCRINFSQRLGARPETPRHLRDAFGRWGLGTNQCFGVEDSQSSRYPAPKVGGSWWLMMVIYG